MQLGDFAGFGTGLLAGAQSGMDMGTKLRALMLREEEQARMRQQQALATRLKAYELSQKHPGSINTLAGILGEDSVTPEMRTQAGEMSAADEAVSALVASGDLPAFQRAAQSNPHVGTRLATNATALAAYQKLLEEQRNATETTAADAEVSALMAGGMSRGDAIRQAYAKNPRRLGMLGRVKDTIGPELTAEQRLAEEDRQHIALDQRDVELGIRPQEDADRLTRMRRGGPQYLAADPAYQERLAEGRGRGMERGRREITPERPKVPSTPAEMAAAEGLTPGTPEFVTRAAAIQQTMHPKTPPRERRNHIVDAQGNVLLYGDDGRAMPLTGPDGQPVKARATASGTIQYQDENGATVYGRIGPDNVITPVQAPHGAPAQPKAPKQSLTEGIMEDLRAGRDPKARFAGKGGQPAPGGAKPAPSTGTAGTDPKRATPPPKAPTRDAALAEAKRLMKVGHSKQSAIAAMRQVGWDVE